MEKLIQLAEGMNNRFPEGNDAFQITTRILEECGEVAKEVNRFENLSAFPVKPFIADSIPKYSLENAISAIPAFFTACI